MIPNQNFQKNRREIHGGSFDIEIHQTTGMRLVVLIQNEAADITDVYRV